MSLIKRSMPEYLDVTDPRDTGEYQPDEPTLDDLFINSLISTLRALEGLTLSEYLPELHECRDRIEKLTVEAEKAPF